MEFSVKSGTADKQRTGCVVAAVFEGRRLSAAAEQLDEASQGALTGILRRGDLDGRAGQVLLLHTLPNVPSERVLLVGCGKEKEFHEARYREAVARSMDALKHIGATEIAFFLSEAEVKGRDVAWKIRQAVEIIEASQYRFEQLKSKPKPSKRALKRVILAVPRRSDLANGEQAIREGQALAAGVRLARDLGNLPGNICTPEYLADQARDLGKHHHFKVSVLEEPDMKSLGMGALLSVSRGSRQPPKGSHFRCRRHLDQAGCQHGRNEVRHVWRRVSAWGHKGRSRIETFAQHRRRHSIERKPSGRQRQQAR
jgi:leucyl aminopeptidase